MNSTGAEWPMWRVNLDTHTNRADGVFSPENVRNLSGVDSAIGFTGPPMKRSRVSCVVSAAKPLSVLADTAITRKVNRVLRNSLHFPADALD